MLAELRVKNFAIIDSLALTLRPGLNVLTGETGAGKSIIIGALGVALGGRAYSEMIKTGSSQASVEAYFDITGHPAIEDMGINTGNGIILRREIVGGAKGRAYINDTMVNVQSLSEAGKTLVDIHGQHEHQSLLAPENQMRLLDFYGKLEEDREKVSSQFAQVEALKKKLNGLRLGARDRAQRIDLLRFQLNEIEAADLKPEEDTQLEEQRNLLANLSRLNELAETAYMGLYGSEDSCTEKLSSSISKLKEMASIDHALSESLDILESAMPLLKEASAALRDSKDRYNIEPERLTEVDDRLHLIKNLKRKYGDTIKTVLSYKEEIKKELESIETSDEKIESLEAEMKGKEEHLLKAAKSLSEKRQKAKGGIETAIRAALKELAMEKARFLIDIKRADLSQSGIDAVEFLFSANPGEAIKPMSKVASGGELSRIMLAIKSVMRNVDDIPVLIFDEVDAGIGGKTAENVARKLKDISRGRQVICITHLPQIASMADNHLLIEKKELKDRVNVIIKELSGNERQEEIARMLSGKITDVSMKHAGELIQRGRTL